MEEKVLITPVNSSTFQVESYSEKDINLISNAELDTAFTSSSDYIEYCVYDGSKNKIYPAETEELLTYTVKDGHINLNPKGDLERLEFNEGDYYIDYRFYRNHLSSSIQNNYFVEQISSNRTEIRLASTIISQEDIINSTNDFIQYRDEKNYFVDFYLNFGNNKLYIANNVKLDTTVDDNAAVLIKLYEPLPADIDLKDLCWVVEEISSPKSYEVKFPVPIFDPQDFEFVAGPNLSLGVKGEEGIASEVFNYNNLYNAPLTSSQQQIQSLLNEKGVNININYENYSEFIKFSSAKTRLENFYYKAGLIESYQNSINSLNTNVTGSTSGSFAFSSSKASYQGKIDNIIKNFDTYEYFLYYDSGSQYSYPKSGATPPYTLLSTGSATVLNWLGSADPNNARYGHLALTASNYDENNQDYLFNAIPEYLRNDSDNRNYELFVDMIGQHFDNIWIYTKDIVNKFDADNRLNFGISKDLVADAVKDFGIKLYSNNFNTNDLYTAFLGITPSGSTYPFTKDQTNQYPVSDIKELIETPISASRKAIPLDDANKRLYKRIYHNLPYLLKTKGTAAGLRALITSYGIPDTILRISEFGDQNTHTQRNYELKQRVYNKQFDVDGTNYFSSSFDTNQSFSDTSNISPKTIQFRFKTHGVPTGSTNHFLYQLENNQSVLAISYTGSSNATGSYSSSIADPNDVYGRIIWYPQGIAGSAPTASVLLPVYDGGWWSVMTTMNYTTETGSLYVANKINNEIGHIASSSVACTSSFYQGANFAHFPGSSSFSAHTPFSGALQEIRYFGPEISQSAFKDFTLNPYSFTGNSITSSFSELAFRAPLGTLLNTASRTSVHPAVTGSYITASFTSSISTYIISSASFSTNRELIYPNQVAAGIRNKINDKIIDKTNILPSGSVLSPFISVAQDTDISQSATPNSNYLEVAFSPTNQVDHDIIGQIGNFNIGDYIGDPRQVSQSLYNYPDLDKVRDAYFKKYIKGYEVRDFVRLIKFFDNSLFKMIKDFVPSKASLSSGVVIKQHLLERNKQRRVNISSSQEQYTGSVKPFVQDYNSGSVYNYSGGAGGFFNKFNSTTTYPSGSKYQGPNNIFNVTQSWDETHQSILGPVTRRHDMQEEFYDGEFSGSERRVKLQRGLGLGDDDPCLTFSTWNSIPSYEYRLAFFSGSDDLFSSSCTGSIPPLFALSDIDFAISGTFAVSELGVIQRINPGNVTLSGSVDYKDSVGDIGDEFYLMTTSSVVRTASFYVNVPNKPQLYRNYNQQVEFTTFATQSAAPTLTFSMITGSTERSASGFEVNVNGTIVAPTVFTASLYSVTYSQSIANSYYYPSTSSLTRTAHITASVPYGYINVGTFISGSVTDPQEALFLVFKFLGYHFNDPASACANISSEFRLDSDFLQDATAIYKKNNVAGIIQQESAGWYSDGNVARYWNGTQFTTTERCNSYL